MLLTPREREVLPYVVSGLLNKETAWELGTSDITIRIHRGQIMKKMAAISRGYRANCGKAWHSKELGSNTKR
ncbi:hypothetical protein H7846_06995 [Edaphobacter sp. 4G125]|nr:hypothetical protein H7846_06995 [Edaphobacter sp. 4G125]